MPVRTPAAPSNPPLDIRITQPAPENTKPPAAEAEDKSPMWFWDLLQEIPRDKWGRPYDLMGFRLTPGASRVEGQKGYLFQVAEPISLAWVKQNYGGGKFRILLQKNSRFETSHEFEIEGAPIYDLSRERPAGAPAAGAAAAGVDTQLMKVLEQQNDRLYQVLQSLQGAKAENPAIGSAVEILTTAYKSGVTAVRESMPQTTDAATQLTGLLAAAEKIATIRSSGGGGLGPLGDLLLPIITPLLQNLLKPKTLLEQITELNALKDFIGGGGDAKDWRAMAVEKGLEHLPSILETFKGTQEANVEIARRKHATAALVRQAHPGAQQPAAAQPAQPQATEMLPASAASSSGLRTARIENGEIPPPVFEETAPPAQAAAPAAGFGAFDPNSEGYANFIKQRIVTLIYEGTGAESLVDFLNGAKPDIVADLMRYAPEQITAFFKQDPILRNAVEHPEWMDILRDAREYIREQAEEAEPAGAAKPPN